MRIYSLLPHTLTIENVSPFSACILPDARYIANPDRVVGGLPSMIDGSLYIVTRDVFDARPERKDLLTPIGCADVIGVTRGLLSHDLSTFSQEKP